MSKRIKEYQEEHQVVLPIKGNKLDIGPGITHKKIILELYEKKVAAPDIAKRVKFLVRRGMDINEISHLTGRGR